jgi:hypothetical protein
MNLLSIVYHLIKIIDIQHKQCLRIIEPFNNCNFIDENRKFNEPLYVCDWKCNAFQKKHKVIPPHIMNDPLVDQEYLFLNFMIGTFY